MIELAKCEAASIMSSWYLHPDFYSAGLYDWVFLGECVEYSLYHELLRIITYKLEHNPDIAKGIASQPQVKRPSLKDMRCSTLSHYHFFGKIRNKINHSPYRKTILVSLRPQNLAVVHALSQSRIFDLVVEGNISNLSDQLKKVDIRYDLFDLYLSTEILEKSQKEHEIRYPLWINAIESESFQQQFEMSGFNFFPEAKEMMIRIFQKQFLELIAFIETLKNLLNNRQISLLLLWNDTLPQHRAAALLCQQYNIPVLHISHGIYSIEPFNNIVYADKVIVYGRYSKDKYQKEGNFPEKIVIAGNPDWDKYKYLENAVDKSAIYAYFKFNPDKYTILFATFASEHRALTEHYYRNLLTGIKQIKQYYSIQLALKLHPVEWFREQWYKDLAAEEGLHDIVIVKEGIEELLMISDLVICRVSSNVEFEAFYLEKQVIVCGGLSVFDEDQDVLALNEPNHIADYINKALLRRSKKITTKERDIITYKYNYLSDGKATSRVMDTISEMIDTKIELPLNFRPYMYLYSLEAKETFIDLQDSNFTFYVDQGNRAYASSDFKVALSLFQKALEIDPHSTIISLKISKTLIGSGDFAQAITFINRLLESDPDNIEARLLYILAAFHGGQFEDCINQIRLLLENMKADTEAKARGYFYLARCHERMAKVEKVEELYEKSILLDPGFKDSYRFLNQYYCSKSNFRKAVNLLERLAVKDPLDDEVFIELGTVYSQAGNPNESIKNFQKALELKPQNPVVTFKLVDVLRNQKKYQEAVSLLDNFLDVNQNHKKAKFFKKRLQIEMQNNLKPK